MSTQTFWSTIGGPLEEGVSAEEYKQNLKDTINKKMSVLDPHLLKSVISAQVPEYHPKELSEQERTQRREQSEAVREAVLDSIVHEKQYSSAMSELDHYGRAARLLDHQTTEQAAQFNKEITEIFQDRTPEQLEQYQKQRIDAQVANGMAPQDAQIAVQNEIEQWPTRRGKALMDAISRYEEMTPEKLSQMTDLNLSGEQLAKNFTDIHRGANIVGELGQYLRDIDSGFIKVTDEERQRIDALCSRQEEFFAADTYLGNIANPYHEHFDLHDMEKLEDDAIRYKPRHDLFNGDNFSHYLSDATGYHALRKIQQQRQAQQAEQAQEMGELSSDEGLNWLPDGDVMTAESFAPKAQGADAPSLDEGLNWLPDGDVMTAESFAPKAQQQAQQTQPQAEQQAQQAQQAQPQAEQQAQPQAEQQAQQAQPQTTQTAGNKRQRAKQPHQKEPQPMPKQGASVYDWIGQRVKMYPNGYANLKNDLRQALEGLQAAQKSIQMHGLRPNESKLRNASQAEKYAASLVGNLVTLELLEQERTMHAHGKTKGPFERYLGGNDQRAASLAQDLGDLVLRQQAFQHHQLAQNRTLVKEAAEHALSDETLESQEETATEKKKQGGLSFSVVSHLSSSNFMIMLGGLMLLAPPLSLLACAPMIANVCSSIFDTLGTIHWDSPEKQTQEQERTATRIGKQCQEQTASKEGNEKDAPEKDASQKQALPLTYDLCSNSLIFDNLCAQKDSDADEVGKEVLRDALIQNLVQLERQGLDKAKQPGPIEKMAGDEQKLAQLRRAVEHSKEFSEMSKGPLDNARVNELLDRNEPSKVAYHMLRSAATRAHQEEKTNAPRIQRQRTNNLVVKSDTPPNRNPVARWT